MHRTKASAAKENQSIIQKGGNDTVEFLPVLDVTDQLHVLIITLHFIHITSQVLMHSIIIHVAYFTWKRVQARRK